MSLFDPYRWLRPLLFRCDPEIAHDKTICFAATLNQNRWALKLLENFFSPATSPLLVNQVFDLHFSSPVGLAAGLDKNGVAVDFWAALGFGFVEVGTVTPGEGQAGNDKPRLERLPRDRAIVNRMGFNNRGDAALAQRLQCRTTRIPVGANLGKSRQTPLENAADDYAACLRVLWPYADYFVVNVSSPNTPGLRTLQSQDHIRGLHARLDVCNRELAQALAMQPKPLLLKIAPDMSEDEMDALAETLLACGFSGVIATNTSLSRQGLTTLPQIEGGLSGAPLRNRALDITRRLHRILRGRVPIIGVGGIMSADDAYRRILAGASLVQIYTALIYEGPSIVANIQRGLTQRLLKDGFRNMAEAIGADSSGNSNVR